MRSIFPKDIDYFIFKKFPGRVIQEYRFKINSRFNNKFSNDKFRNDLLNELIRSEIETSALEIFVNTVLKVLSKNAPVRNIMLQQMKFLSWTKL